VTARTCISNSQFDNVQRACAASMESFMDLEGRDFS
jgi:hypothetical protein